MWEQLQDPELWKYVSIPFVAGAVGWVTNWLAIQLTFYPVRPWGRPPFFGWWGIIPSKAEKMAVIFVDSTMSRLGTVQELFDQMEPEKISEQIVRVISPRLDAYTDEVMLQSHPILWENLPEMVKNRLYQRVRDELPRLVDRLTTAIGRDVESVLDFKHMIVGRLVRERELLNRLFLECGAEEFKFLVNSGFGFGFLFGLVQLAVWIAYPAGWVLPVFGLLVGWATNWIALNLIFRPLHPEKIGPFVLHGLFLKRQAEVAGVWCRIVTREILTIRQLIRAMLTGPRAQRTQTLIKKHMKPLVDEAVGPIRTAAQLTVGLRGFADIKASVAEKAVDLSLEPFNDWAFNEDRAVVVERLLYDRMASLPSEEFQDLLRPCFQEDEAKLIAVGAILGFLAGVAQLVFVFS